MISLKLGTLSNKIHKGIDIRTVLLTVVIVALLGCKERLLSESKALAQESSTSTVEIATTKICGRISMPVSRNARPSLQFDNFRTPSQFNMLVNLVFSPTTLKPALTEDFAVGPDHISNLIAKKFFEQPRTEPMRFNVEAAEKGFIAELVVIDGPRTLIAVDNPARSEPEYAVPNFEKLTAFQILALREIPESDCKMVADDHHDHD